MQQHQVVMRAGITRKGYTGFDEYLLWNLTDTTSTYNERYKNPQLIENGKMKKYENSEYGPELFVKFIKSFITYWLLF